MCHRLLRGVKAQGYQPGVYASTLWFRKRIDLNRLKSYSIWNAHYNVAGSPIACDMCRVPAPPASPATADRST